MIKQTGLTDKEALIDTIIRNTVIEVHRLDIQSMVENHLEDCQEYWIEGVRAGYALVFNFNGMRSFDGYKLVKGYSLAAFRIAKKMLKKYPDAIIAFTDDKPLVKKLALMLGYRETLKKDNMIKMEVA